MPRFTVNYTFTMQGELEVEAENEEAVTELLRTDTTNAELVEGLNLGGDVPDLGIDMIEPVE